MAYYGVMCLVFHIADMLAGHYAGSRPRMFWSWALALIWPVSVPFALVAAGVVVGRLRTTTHQEPEADE